MNSFTVGPEEREKRISHRDAEVRRKAEEAGAVSAQLSLG